MVHGSHLERAGKLQTTGIIKQPQCDVNQKGGSLVRRDNVCRPWGLILENEPRRGIVIIGAVCRARL